MLLRPCGPVVGQCRGLGKGPCNTSPAGASEPAPRLARKRARLGAHTVEFALCAPIWFVLILGMFEFGRAFMVMQLLNDAARRGCRVGIIEGASTQQIK